jgi:arylsulfatase A-like enzyme
LNVVLLIIDTLRYDYVGANGNPHIRTPNLDRLAARSWRFERAFSNSGRASAPARGVTHG